MISASFGARLRGVLALFCLLLATACGGGGGGGGNGSLGSGGGGGGGTGSSGGSGGGTTTPMPTANTVAVTIDDGPDALGQGSDPYRQVNVPYVTITLCVPGGATCQTIDHVEIDTGSVGLRIIAPVLSAAMRAGLPYQTLANGDQVGECYGYVDGYAFGSVRTADFTIGGEKVSAMPIHVVGDDGRYAAVPQRCSAGGGAAFTDVHGFGANAILGIGVAPTDCGDRCATQGGYAAAIYFDCPAGGCGAIASRASTTSAPFEQLPNPVAAFAADNNGSILEFAQPATDGSTRTLTGTLTFGIGTQTNNSLGSARVLATTASTDDDGYGLLTASYAGRSLPQSFVDSGSNAFLFTDANVPQCSKDKGYYCPGGPIAAAATLTGSNGASADAGFTLRNAETLFDGGGAAVPGLGADPGAFDEFSPYPDSLDFGLPFFFGRRVFTAIEGRSAGGNAGPFIAY